MKYTRFFPLILFSSLVLAQGGPPPPGPLGPPPVPAGNPITTAKANLGKTLFWEEQLSSTRTVACGTCHQPASGGSDARSGSINSLNPGPDGVFQTPDDIIGSPGVPLHEASGTYTWSDAFGIYEQVTGRKSPSAVNSAYAPRLFWDGRATGTFRDPLTNAVVINNGAALESQVLGPPVSSAEMAHQSRNWQQVADQIASATPLVLAESIPRDLANWLADRGYPALFEEAFGSTEVTPTRIAMAIATYERTLVSDQTPLDADASGVPNALTQQERRGRNVFVQNDCAQCHAGPLLTDNNFHYIGVRPVNDDLGRFNETGNNQDRGAFKTPGLRNVSQRSHFFHNGRFQTLQEVIDFYDRGGDFNAPNKDPRIRPRNMTANQKADLLAFLTRPLTDLRVANEQAPFDRPTLFSESNRVPQISGSGKGGSGGFSPVSIAIEPPLLGNPQFTLAVDETLGGAAAVLAVDTVDPGLNAIPSSAAFARLETTTQGSGPGDGYASQALSIPASATWQNVPLFARWYITDPGAAGGFSVSPLIQFTPFGPVTQGNACAYDLNGDGTSNVRDMIVLIDQFGPCAQCSGDLNQDQIVDQTDMYILCTSWLNGCP